MCMSNEVPPGSSGWETLSDDLEGSTLATKISFIVRSANKPWHDIGLLPKSPVDVGVLNALQKELDEAWKDDPQYFTACFRCLHALTKERELFPESFVVNEGVVRESGYPIDGGEASDIWKGTVDGRGVCLKVFRTFSMTVTETKSFFKELCHEAVIWKHLHHKNILPFIGINTTSFVDRFCLISPWMQNGNVIKFLESNKDHDRLKCIREIASAVAFLHGFNPHIAHCNIHGTNVLVDDNHTCCLAGFGSVIIHDTQTPPGNVFCLNSARWLAPEFQLIDTPCEQYSFPARDIYALGCTIIEIFTLQLPFPHISNNSSVSKTVIKSTYHPRPPADVFPCDKLWALVEDCMALQCDRRPSATEVMLAEEKVVGPRFRFLKMAYGRE
ncbi:kinase-like protein [Armillaria gallica]|uniref:Kinase-like protein n=1 Tax=Armillaria gallica TaxID=47427 RepID=A0A2H3DJW8_ARMGA|nr:kinase-like protein [Armillaria gallica]